VRRQSFKPTDTLPRCASHALINSFIISRQQQPAAAAEVTHPLPASLAAWLLPSQSASINCRYALQATARQASRRPCDDNSTFRRIIKRQSNCAAAAAAPAEATDIQSAWQAARGTAPERSSDDAVPQCTDKIRYHSAARAKQHYGLQS